MVKLTLREAKEYFEEMCPTAYYFSSEFQSDDIAHSPICIRQKYSKMIVSSYTDTICFFDDDNIMSLSGVREVEVPEFLFSGAEVHITCLDGRDQSGLSSFTITVY